MAEKIAADLRDAIERGDYGPGDRLPGENTLIQDYGAARLTVRSALAKLQAEGLTVSRQGAGVFVREFKPVIRNGINRVSARQWNAGKSMWDTDTAQRNLTVDGIEVTPEEEAAGDIAALLALGEGAAVAIRRRRYLLDDKPVLSATSYLPAELVADSPIVEADTGPGGIYARLADLGHAPAHFREDIVSRMPTRAEKEELQMQAATPVYIITRTAVTQDGTPVEVNIMTADASAYVLRYDFDT
ncbi:GntR family transcriptional regulator [Myceligenerans halotolerans]